MLAVTEADLKRVAQAYFDPSQASIAVITSHSGLEAATETVSRLSLSVEEL